MSRRVVVLLVLLAVGALGIAAWSGGAGQDAGSDRTGAATTAPGTTDRPGEAGSPGGEAESGTPGPDAAEPRDGLPPRLAFLGDSLTYGIGAPPGEGYAWQTADLLGWPVVAVDGVPGSGYVATGLGDPMPARVGDVVAAAPDVVVVVGGNNDVFRGHDADAVGRAARELLDGLVTGLPDAEVVVVGPFPNLVDDPGARAEVRDAVRRAAEETGVVWLDPEELLADTLAEPGAWALNLSEDGLHPNADGYGLIAEALAPRLAELVAPVPR